MQHFVGIDPGLNSFAAVKISNLGSLESTELSVKPIVAGGGILDDYLRTDRIKKDFTLWLESSNSSNYAPKKAYQGPVIAIEGPSMARQATRSIQTGFVHRAIYEALFWAYTRFSLIVVPPKTLKIFASGKGNADKVFVLESIIEKYGNLRFGSQDLYEAFALAKLAENYCKGELEQIKYAKVLKGIDVFDIDNGEVSSAIREA